MKFVYIGTTLVSVLLFLFYWLGIPVGGQMLGGTFYYYLLYALLGFNVFVERTFQNGLAGEDVGQFVPTLHILRKGEIQGAGF